MIPMFDAMRRIDRKFANPFVQSPWPWPFKVEPGAGDRSIIIVNAGGEQEKFHPEEVSTMILLRMKEAGEAYLGCKVSDAVMTMPALSITSGSRPLRMRALSPA
jgi:heat shock protein 1/8